jgi:hypothetical protein
MIVSDKFAVNGRRRMKALQSRRAVYKNNVTNKSVSRTRKEKCQTEGPQCRNYAVRCHRATAVCRFHLCFDHVSFAYTPNDLRLGLTLLTVACQKCQTIRHPNSPLDRWISRQLSCRGPPQART